MDNLKSSPSFDGVIFLPGLLCDERLFAPQRQALGDRVSIEVADLGHHDNFRDMAEAVLSQTRFERFALAGLSMGGALAMNLARWAPDRVERLAILDANPGCDDDVRRANRRRQIEEADKTGVGELSRQELVEIYLAPENRTPTLINTVGAMAERHGLAVYKRQQNALMTRESSRPYLPKYPGRTLVLCGELDVQCPPELHREMANLIPDATLVVVPGAGHLVTMEAPDAVNAALADWLQL